MNKEVLEKRLKELKAYKIDVYLLLKKEGDSEHLEREMWETEGKIKLLEELLKGVEQK